MDGGKGRSMEEAKARKTGRMEETEAGKKSKEGKKEKARPGQEWISCSLGDSKGGYQVFKWFLLAV